jgi:hypothetical protein
LSSNSHPENLEINFTISKPAGLKVLLKWEKPFNTHYFLHNLLLYAAQTLSWEHFKRIIAASFVTLISFVKVEVTFFDQILVINCHKKHWSNATF